jgi:selenocysteine-specific elongation factor
MEKYITIGIAGHVDHGKTALVRCLTGMDTDRLHEEKRRGLSMESGIAPLNLLSGIQTALVDVPGHTDFLKNTIRGLSSTDMAILVVAADDGVMPQTLEHIEILNLLKIKTGFIVLSKADLVDNETVELAELEIRDLISNTFLEANPIIRFSAIDKRGLQEIRMQIESDAEKIEGKDLQSSFRLWIDQIRSFTGFGTVVSGTILSGIIRSDDILYLLPSEKKIRVRFLEVHHQKVQQAVAGQRVGINLHRVPLKEVRCGMALAKPGLLSPGYLINVVLYVLKGATKPIRNHQRVKLYLGASIINAMVTIMEKQQLEPGEKGLVQFRLMKQVAALPKDVFVVCPLNVHTVVGGGTVLEIPQEKYRQVKASKIIPYLRALWEKNLKIIVEHFFDNNPNKLVTVGELARNTGFPFTELEAEMKARVKSEQLLYFEGRGFFAKTRYQTLKRQLPEVIEKILTQDSLKVNATAEEIKNQLAPFLDETPFQRMLAELCDESRLIKTNGGFQISNLSVKLSDERKMLINLLLDYAQTSGVAPFSAQSFWKFHKRKININEIKRLLDYLHNKKRLICLNNRRFLSPQAMDQIKERVKSLIRDKGNLAVGDCKEVFGYGRTAGIPVLEYLDSIGFTRRQGNERVLTREKE